MPNQHKRAPLSIRLPEDTEGRLRAYAARLGLSVSAAVELAVTRLLDDEDG